MHPKQTSNPVSYLLRGGCLLSCPWNTNPLACLNRVDVRWSSPRARIIILHIIPRLFICCLCSGHCEPHLHHLVSDYCHCRVAFRVSVLIHLLGEGQRRRCSMKPNHFLFSQILGRRSRRRALYPPRKHFGWTPTPLLRCGQGLVWDQHCQDHTVCVWLAVVSS
jgi:hypothetical protein